MQAAVWLFGLKPLSSRRLRDLDAIQPTDSSSLGDYALPELLGLSQLAPGTLRHSYGETVQVVDDLVLVMTAFITPQGLPLPPDLQQLSLQLPESLKAHPGQSLVMDSDCFFEKRFAYDHNVVESRIRQLHDALLGIFKQSLTEKARLKWKL